MHALQGGAVLRPELRRAILASQPDTPPTMAADIPGYAAMAALLAMQVRRAGAGGFFPPQNDLRRAGGARLRPPRRAHYQKELSRANHLHTPPPATHPAHRPHPPQPLR